MFFTLKAVTHQMREFSLRQQSKIVKLITKHAKVHFKNEQSLTKTEQMERDTMIYIIIALYIKHTNFIRAIERTSVLKDTQHTISILGWSHYVQ